MLPSQFLRMFISILLFSYTMFVYAEDSACLLEGKATIMEQSLDIKDCLMNNGVSEEKFKGVCDGLIKMLAPMGGDVKINYMKACPSPAQGACVGLFGQPMTSYYYKRDAELMADTKKACLAQGGKWEDS